MATFSASNISRLLAKGEGKTAASYCLEVALKELGIFTNIDTSATKHGLANQFTAFKQCIEPKYNGAIWFDESLPINENASASPDFLTVGGCGDIKCPSFVDTYLDQINRVPTKYYQQVQMQMMAAQVDIGVLCFYLTKPEVWGVDEWEEYPMPLEDRHKIFEFTPDLELQEEILKAVERYTPHKNNLVLTLKEAKVMDEVEFFYHQLKGNKYRNIKDSSNIFGLEELIRVNDNFYYLKR